MENLNTNLIYLNDDMICGCNSKVFYCEKLNDKELKSIKNYIQNIDFNLDNNKKFEDLVFYSIILEDTIFYPQSFGQDCDSGYIETSESKFKVIHVKKINNYVKHIGFYLTDKMIEVSADVVLTVDKDRRSLNSRLHTAGHLIDDAFLKLGYKIDNDTGTKASHKINSSYVELKIDKFYHDNILFAKALENIANSQIKDNLEVKKIIVDKEEIEKFIYKKSFIPPNLDKVRIVITNGNKGIMCGGTHVSFLGEIGKIKIDNLLFEDNILKVEYSLE